MRIVQVGAYPPPYGGVTVHLARLHHYLVGRGLASAILDLSAVDKGVPGVEALDWPGAINRIQAMPRSVIHFHNFAPGHAAVYERTASRHVTVLSLHNERFADELDQLGPIRRRVALSRLRRVHCIVVDNPHCERLARSIWGARAEIHHVPEFIAPANVPPLEHRGVLELRERCRFLLASNAWKISFHRDEDLYGLDLLAEMMHSLVTRHDLDVGLVFLLPQVGDPEYLDSIVRRLARYGVGQRCLFVTNPLPESSSLWRCADVVIRATNTDGNSMTVLEALAQGVPVVASDCVGRPSEAVLFRNRDAEDLTAQVARVLQNLPAHRERVAGFASRDNAALLVDLYGSLQRKYAA